MIFFTRAAHASGPGLGEAERETHGGGRGGGVGGGVCVEELQARGSPLLMANQKSRVSVNCSHHLEP